MVLEPEVVAVKAEDFRKEPTPLEELDSYVDDLVEEEREREKRDRQAFINDPKASLEERLEKGDPVRKSRGKLVGIVCLSDILRYVIGEQSLGGEEKEVGVRSRGTSVASSAPSSHPDPPPEAGRGNVEAGVQSTAQVTSPTTTLDATKTIPEDKAL